MKPKKGFVSSPYLNLPLWSFCLRSLFKEYGNAFLLKIALPHPIKTLEGLRDYARFTGKNSSRASAFSPIEMEPKWTGGKSSVVGIGFCAKPLDPLCPSGRANHDCIYFEHNLHIRKDPQPEACRNCLVRKMGSAALTSESDFYIMTSAIDILADLFLPALKTDAYNRALLVLCQYSFEPFKIALLISGIDAVLFPFEKGDCKDYSTWRQADKGIKNTHTEFSDRDLETIENILKRSTQKLDLPPKFTKSGHIFQFDA